MWQNWVQWHRNWEDELLSALLAPPASQVGLSPFKRRLLANLADVSQVERCQLHDFATRNRGWRGYLRWVLLPVLLFSLAGGLLHLGWPTKFGLLMGVLLGNLMGMSLGFGLMVTWFNYRKFSRLGWRDLLKVILLAVVGAFAGAAGSTWFDGKPVLVTLQRIGQLVGIAGLATGAVYALLIGMVSRLRAGAFEAENNRLQAQAEHERLARQLSDARLRLLEAQIEPHFLFNTLGAVQQLAEDGAPRAAALTADLIQFLRSSLNQMRGDSVTLAADFTMVEAYLRVMQARLGPRLQFGLDLPGELAQQILPPMMLLTLVENAIKHGIEPALRGGEIRVSARQQGNSLQIKVSDSGAGLTEPSGQGTGLANIRERLQLTFGPAAELKLYRSEEEGTVALLQLPTELAHQNNSPRDAS